MRKFLFAAVLLLCFLFDIYAGKNYTSDKIIFLPQDFYVGDLVEMRVVIRPDYGVKVEKPESFPSSYWVRIENAEVFPGDGEYELRIYLRPFAPGIRTLPVMQFGDIHLRDIRIQTKSVLDEGATPFAPPAEQIDLPGTNYYAAAIIGVLFLLPIFFIFFWNKLKKVFRAYILEIRKRRPYRRLQKALADLEKSINDKKGKDFYTILVDELRIYLTARGSIDYKAATAKESARMISKDFRSIAGYYNLIKIFELADKVKFGGRRVLASRREEDLLAVRGFVEKVENVDI